MDQQSTGQPAEPFNGLTPAQAERLAMLAEECGEIIQVVGKILRHGYDSCHPDNPCARNGYLLGREIADFSAVELLMNHAGDPYYKVDQDDVAEAMRRKLRFAHHQPEAMVVPGAWPDGTPRNLPPQYYPEAASQASGLPPGHQVLEQTSLPDARVRQTVQVCGGYDYVRIVHVDEALPWIAPAPQPEGQVRALMDAAQTILDRGYVSQSIADEKPDHDALRDALAALTPAPQAEANQNYADPVSSAATPTAQEAVPVAWCSKDRLYVTFDPRQARAHARHGTTLTPLFAHPPQPSETVAQFLCTEDGEINGNTPVASIVPPGSSGCVFVFEGGTLHVGKDGSGYIVVAERDFTLEDDRGDGPDGPEGSVHWIARFPVGEMAELRDFLNGQQLDPPAPAPEVAELHLLEEVCAFYANDEDRFLKDAGEPYGSIPTEVGLKAREARERFRKREARPVSRSWKEPNDPDPDPVFSEWSRNASKARSDG